MPLTVRREELEAVAGPWARLVERLPTPVPFVHPTWQRVWLDEFRNGRELVLLTVRDGDELIGVAPFLRDEARLSLVGHRSICDYMDVVVAPGREDDVFPALWQALSDLPWAELDLPGLGDGSPTLTTLLTLARSSSCEVEQTQEAVAPGVDLPESWDAYLAGLPKKDRHELRRKLRRLQAAGELEFRTYTTADELRDRLTLLLQLMVASRSDKARFMTEQMGRFFHQMTVALAEEGLIRLHELELNRRPVASVLCFEQAGQVLFYNSGYDPQHAPLAVGLISKALALRDAIERGCRRADFLRGAEPYKYDLGAQDRAIYRCLIRRV